MKPIFQKATIFCVDMPPVQEVDEALETQEFTDLSPTALSGAGFERVDDPSLGPLFLEELANGFAFTVRIDKKVLPPEEVDRRVAERMADAPDLLDVKDRRAMKANAREDVMREMAALAFVKTRRLRCYYVANPSAPSGTGYLFVPTISNEEADTSISTLILALGSMTTHTIHVADLVNGATEKLRAQLAPDSNPAFGPIDVSAGVWVWLQRKGDEGTEKVTYQVGDQMENAEPIRHALDRGFKVKAIEMKHAGFVYRLRSDFKLQAIRRTEANDERAEETEDFRLLASADLKLMAHTVDTLCAVFGYQPPAEETPDASAE